MFKKRELISLTLLLVIALAACTPAALATSSPIDGEAPAGTASADLAPVKDYLLGQVAKLQTATIELTAAADSYYALAEAEGFDYAALWANQPEALAAALADAKQAWIAASPAYEQMEGIVAGVPTLADYDVILDAGASSAEDPEGAVPFDLELPDGRVFPQPGNLFGVLESTLWGTYSGYASGVTGDLDTDGEVEFGEHLPDANVFKGASDLTASYVTELGEASQAWEPTESDAFTALVVMVPTMSEYFESWKNSRFVAGETSEQRDFVVISRLADIQDILTSLEVVYAQIKPLVAGYDSGQADLIETGMAELKAFVAGVYEEELAGKQFTAEEADALGAEAQDRATAVAGQVAQAAAALGIAIEE
jgi:hypothetical protein